MPKFVSNERRVLREEGQAPDNKVRIWAFTLIELLTVIAIIGVLAGLVVGLSGLATGKARESRIRTEHSRLVMAIESYKMAMNAFPQDNQLTNLLQGPETPEKLHERAGKNLLYYELSGALFTSNRTFQVLGRATTDTVTPNGLRNVFGVGGIENSARTEREVPYRQTTFKPDQFRPLDTPEGQNYNVLVIPLKGPNEYDGIIPPATGSGAPTRVKINPWFYDATSTNRHNLEGYDLWAEYLVGRDNKVRVIKNWITTTRPGIISND